MTLRISSQLLEQTMPLLLTLKTFIGCRCAVRFINNHQFRAMQQKLMTVSIRFYKIDT